MDFKDWVNLGTASANAESRGAGIATAYLVGIISIFYAPILLVE